MRPVYRDFLDDSVGYEPFHTTINRAFREWKNDEPIIDDLVCVPGEPVDETSELILSYTAQHSRDFDFYESMASFLRECKLRKPEEIHDLAAVIWNDQDNRSLRGNASVTRALIGALYAHDFVAREDDNPYANNLLWSLVCAFEDIDYLDDFDPRTDGQIGRVIDQTSRNLKDRRH
ncbi:hypothetical protein FIV42_22815 [Persicimonas caeni]|uniref:Uncharacterized protein n=1 Tax=Persicimonas caeni TaxID=2292766 RepID=A0A4Y6PYS1_PERCE|nr:hypothetical protein [Persicimonas caeni]QDG53471.1 hypothetical protein FIV42_22815 [Persicimonas caeni]QED34692.1 hypothetical protein FRD00_22810 [Persicimonas caeni]